jgi:hypothetical protein
MPVQWLQLLESAILMPEPPVDRLDTINSLRGWSLTTSNGQ